MQVILNDEIINVEIIRKNNKHIYFRINDDLDLVITCNLYVRKKELISLIDKNKLAITKMYLNKKKQKKREEEFYFLGNKYTLVIDGNFKKINFQDDYLFTPNIKILEKFIHDEIIRIFTTRLEFYRENMNFVPKFKLRVRKMKTRWGVCNKTKRIITLNSELIKKSIHLIDYVIVHELCHFKEANHGNNFWALVALYFPDYKEARKKLKE